ncbi:MAG: endonuclease/exonuclease/phosphatase family protein [Ramlibacter sp.]|nr:endonuclease/exonuclease/phosphatase family protein [Ramlibacter sp.]
MKLLTWNVQWFLGLDGVVDAGRVIAHARQLCDFDVLCLQEVAVNFPGLEGAAAFDQAAAVAQLLPGYEVFFAPAVDYGGAPGAGRERFGNLVATRLPASLVEHHPLPLLSQPGTLSVRRVCTTVLVHSASGPVTIMNTHLEYHSAAQRALQVQRILDIHRENCDLVLAQGARKPQAGLYRARPRTPRAILCGDFNFDAGSSEYLSLTRGDTDESFRDVYASVHGAAPRPATFGRYDDTYVKQPIACDHVFATMNFAGRARRFEVDGLTRYSDHQPVHVEWEAV